MKRILAIGTVALTQLVLVGAAVAPQLSARVTGEAYLLRVAPVDPIDPFRGAYVALDFPDLRQERAMEEWETGLGRIDDDERGDVFISLRPDGELWMAEEWTRERPDAGPYLACDDRGWQTRCGIESLFLPQEDAAAMEEQVRDGAVAEIRIDAWGNAAVVDVREKP